MAEDPVGVGVADGGTEEVGDEPGAGELVVGEADGDEADGVAVAVADGEREGAAGAELVPCAGPTKSGDCAGGRPVKSRARAAMATPRTATAPPVATPAANERRSRRYSVVRRSRSQPGSAARRAAQLLTGAAARPG